MAQEFSFDVVSDFDHQEMVNAVDQTRREIQTRYDFKGVTVEITLEKEQLVLLTESDMQLRAILDVLQSKLHRRGIDLKVLDPQKPEPAAKGNVRQVVKLRRGISEELARTLTKKVRTEHPKVQVAHPGRPAADRLPGEGRAPGRDPGAAGDGPRGAARSSPITDDDGARGDDRRSIAPSEGAIGTVHVHRVR